MLTCGDGCDNSLFRHSIDVTVSQEYNKAALRRWIANCETLVSVKVARYDTGLFVMLNELKVFFSVEMFQTNKE